MSILIWTSRLPVAMQPLEPPLLPGVFTYSIHALGAQLRRFLILLLFRERRLCTPICLFMKYASSSSYYGARFFGLHHFWFTIYRLGPTAHDSDMETAATSRRTSWIEAVNRMQKVWALIMTVPIIIIP